MAIMNATATTNVSGQPITVSGNIVQISGQHVFVESGVLVVIQSGAFVNISGQGVSVLSGTGVIIQSGAGVIIQSGANVISTANISGQAVTVSGNIVQISGQATLISGQIIGVATPSLLRQGYTNIGSLSGGTQLSSGIVVTVKVRNLPGNNIIWDGGGAVVNSGTGFLLLGGESDEFDINNLNAVYLYAVTSGQQVSWRAEAQ